MSHMRARRIRIGVLIVAAYWLALFVATHVPDTGVLFPQNFWDKLQHFFAYGLLAGLLCCVLQTRPHPTLRRYLWILLVVLAYGAVDEALQSLIPGRYSEFLDWVADGLGALAAITIHYAVSRVRGRSDEIEATSG